MVKLKKNKFQYSAKKLKLKNDLSPILASLYVRREGAKKMLSDLIKIQREGINLSDSIEEFDRAEKEMSASTNYRLIERKSYELKNIEKLIQKVLDNDEFGYCDECGEIIDPKRLMVMPEATLCIECQRQLESPGRNFSSGGSYVHSKWQEESEDHYIEDADVLSSILLKQDTETLSLAEMEEVDIIDNHSEGEEEDDEVEEDDDEYPD